MKDGIKNGYDLDYFGGGYFPKNTRKLTVRRECGQWISTKNAKHCKPEKRFTDTRLNTDTPILRKRCLDHGGQQAIQKSTKSHQFQIKLPKFEKSL